MPGIDFLPQWAPFAVFFPLFIADAISHAFKLIDGLNWLAGFTGLTGSLSLATIAHQVGLTEHRDIQLIIGAAISGFLTINYPFGTVFFGNVGAYIIGHLLVWMSVSILYNALNISPFAILLIFFGPAADTSLAITRGFAMEGPIAAPDRLHFHQLVLRSVEITFLGRKKGALQIHLRRFQHFHFFHPDGCCGNTGNKPFRGCNRLRFFGVVFVATYKFGLLLAPKLRR